MLLLEKQFSKTVNCFFKRLFLLFQFRGKIWKKIIQISSKKKFYYNNCCGCYFVTIVTSSVTRCWNKRVAQISKGDPKSSHSSFYRKSYVFQNSPKSHQILLATIVRKIIKKNFHKSPNLVKLHDFSLSMMCFLNQNAIRAMIVQGHSHSAGDINKQRQRENHICHQSEHDSSQWQIINSSRSNLFHSISLNRVIPHPAFKNETQLDILLTFRL